MWIVCEFSVTSFKFLWHDCWKTWDYDGKVEKTTQKHVLRPLVIQISSLTLWRRMTLTWRWPKWSQNAESMLLNVQQPSMSIYCLFIRCACIVILSNKGLYYNLYEMVQIFLFDTAWDIIGSLEVNYTVLKYINFPGLWNAVRFWKIALIVSEIRASRNSSPRIIERPWQSDSGWMLIDLPVNATLRNIWKPVRLSK